MFARLSTICLTVLLLSVGIEAKAQLSFTLFPTQLTLAPSSSYTFQAMLTNTGPNELFLNANRFQFGSTGVTLDDTYFFTNVPLSLRPSEVWSGPIFDVVAGADASPDTYFGDFSILGGESSSSVEDLASTAFSVTIPSTTASAPEPATGALMFLGSISTLLMSLRMRKLCCVK